MLDRIDRARGLVKKLGAALPFVVPVALVARSAIRSSLARAGHPAATLDDTYIHFQYARAIAEGHPFRFHAGQPPTSGATSFLWPAALAPFYALGMHGHALMLAAWALAFTAHAGIAYETFHLARRLAGRAAAVGASAMAIVFGGFVWGAASGMEIVPFAWALVAVARRSAEWAELAPGDRTRRVALVLSLFAWTAALLRPEGALAALFAGVTLLAFPARGGFQTRAIGALPLAAIAAPSVLLLALTGHAASSTTTAKWLVQNPYARRHLFASIRDNARFFFEHLLNGDDAAGEFLPSHGAVVGVLGLCAIVVLGFRERARWRALAVLSLALAMLVPCTYSTFLWNRLRYLWPFATGWLIGLACLARLVGDALARVRPTWRVATPLTAGAFVGLFAFRLAWVTEDIGECASGIDRQQVTLAVWILENLPKNARVGVNDTGAIGYFGEHTTFDIVGLTTPGEARYWVAGAASRFEHYEKLGAKKLPEYFAVYPAWMACDAVLGKPLVEATVTDANIVGSPTMRIYEANYMLLGSGEKPQTPTGAIEDALDVADLESEADHRYELLRAEEGEQYIRTSLMPDGTLVTDGGRTARTREAFVAHVPKDTAIQGLVRIESDAESRVAFIVDGERVATEAVSPGAFHEIAFPLKPTARGEARIELEVVEGGALTTYHYWFTRTTESRTTE